MSVWKVLAQELDKISELELSETNEKWGRAPGLELITTIIWKERYHTKVAIDLLSDSVIINMEDVFKEFVDLHIVFF